MKNAAAYQSFLEGRGYIMRERSVHGKNQTRFHHFVLEKDGRRWFCKVNHLPAVLAPQLNSALVRLLTADAPPGVRFLAPAQELIWGDALFHIYPFVDQLPVSNEAAGFKDFLVEEAGLPLFFARVLDAVDFVGAQDIITANEGERWRSPRHAVVEMLRRLPAETPYAVELLQYVLAESARLPEYALAINDIQPQNMFWSTSDQSLILFDLEHLAPQRRFRDVAYFFINLWLVCGRPEYARQFLALAVQRLSPADRHAAYAYVRLHLSELYLTYYGAFKDAEHRKRLRAVIRWVRLELLPLVNGIGR